MQRVISDMGTCPINRAVVILFQGQPPNKRVQSDAAAAAGIAAKIGYVTRLEVKPISGKSRRVSRAER